MMAKSHIVACALAGSLACSLAWAQNRPAPTPLQAPHGTTAHVRSTARATVSANRTSSATTQPAQRTRIIQISPSGEVTTGFSPALDAFGFSTLGVPGLGFDYPHLAAISGALENSSFGSHRHDHFGQGSFVPILFGGYPYYYDEGEYDQQQQPEPQAQQQPQPQVIVIQQPVPSQASQGNGNDSNSYSNPSPAAGGAPVHDVGEFVLVRRDGRVLFASMFMIAGTQVTYVTPEGFRRTLSLSDMDVDATQQMNEARGTTIQLHK